MKYLTSLLIACLSLLSFCVTAAEGQCVAQEKKVVLLYANGMLNTEKDADRGLALSIVELHRNKSAQGLKVKYKKLYNTSESMNSIGVGDSKYWRIGIIPEVLEVARQYTGFQVERFLDWFNVKAVDISPEEETMYASVVKEVWETVGYDKELKEQIDIYTDAINAGYKLMVIAHSQGNLYTSKVYKDFLLNNYEHGKDYTILSVGTPVVLPEKEGMLRDIQDPIAKFSANFPNGTEVSNRDIPSIVTNAKEINNDASYHSYLTYLYGSDSREYFQDYFTSSIEKLFDDIGDNAVKITLNKNGNSSLHLGVYEASAAGGLPSFAASSADPMGSLFDPRGSIVTKDGKDIYTIKCGDLPLADVMINGGVWNSGFMDNDATVIVSTVDGQSSGKKYTVEPSTRSSYSGSEGVRVKYNDDGNYSFFH